MDLSDEQWLASWRSEQKPQPEGWSFSDLETRMTETPVPWDIDLVYRTALADATSVLDMGTGGGEFLLTFANSLPRDTVATEGWAPNVLAARRNLQAVGVDVVEYSAPDEDVDSLPMPFPDDRFDLVLNRHESYSPRELARVIAPGGRFVTQQVGGDEAHEIGQWFGEHAELPHVNLAHCARELEEAGFDVTEAEEHVGKYLFNDVAALVAYLQLVPWDAPSGFTVDAYAEDLLALHRETGGGPVRLTQKRFWLRAVLCA